MNQGMYPGFTDVTQAPVPGNVLIVDLSGPWTVPVPDFEVEICGGGAGGNVTPGGPSGGYVRKRFSGVLVGTVATIILGTNGTGRGASAGGGAAPTNGGQSVFILPGYTTLVAGGGDVATNTGGIATGGDINLVGQNGSPAFLAAGGSDTTGNIGGSNPMGIGGMGASRDGTGAGSGGSGPAQTGATFLAGGNGRAGRAIIRWETTP